jgi:hypothetical protein
MHRATTYVAVLLAPVRSSADMAACCERRVCAHYLGSIWAWRVFETASRATLFRVVIQPWILGRSFNWAIYSENINTRGQSKPKSRLRSRLELLAVKCRRELSHSRLVVVLPAW